jgi:excisionase family DNA binding protein
MTSEALWTVKETAAYLRMSQSWVYHQIQAGTLPYCKIGCAVRFVPDQVRQYASAKPSGAAVIPLRQRGR